jgi:Putative restriction endonuclease
MTVLTQSPVSPDERLALPAPAEVPDVPIWRLTVEQYHAMIDAGILQSGDPVELLDGWLVQKMTKYPPHGAAVGLTGEALRGLLPPGWVIRYQDPITTATSEPEPDVVAARGSYRDYARRHPAPAEVGLVIEVSDTSLATDRGRKKRIYAQAAIATYWIVNLIDNQVEVYTELSGPGERPGYNHRQDYRPGDEVPIIIDGREVGRLRVQDLLP